MLTGFYLEDWLSSVLFLWHFCSHNEPFPACCNLFLFLLRYCILLLLLSLTTLVSFLFPPPHYNIVQSWAPVATLLFVGISHYFMWMTPRPLLLVLSSPPSCTLPIFHLLTAFRQLAFASNSVHLNLSSSSFLSFPHSSPHPTHPFSCIPGLPLSVLRLKT